MRDLQRGFCRGQALLERLEAGSLDLFHMEDLFEPGTHAVGGDFARMRDEDPESWERAVAADSGHAAAHEELALYYAAKGDAARAARHRDAYRSLTAPR